MNVLINIARKTNKMLYNKNDIVWIKISKKLPRTFYEGPAKLLQDVEYTSGVDDIFVSLPFAVEDFNEDKKLFIYLSEIKHKVE